LGGAAGGEQMIPDSSVFKGYNRNDVFFFFPATNKNWKLLFKKIK
jgi:hypothetical protein